MGDAINPMNSSNSEDEDEGNDLAPIKGMCYESLCDHYRTHCKNVEIQCTSCDQFYRRSAFVRHPCYLQLKDI